MYINCIADYCNNYEEIAPFGDILSVCLQENTLKFKIINNWNVSVHGND